MSRRVALICALSCAWAALLGGPSHATPPAVDDAIDCLREAYPEHICQVTSTEVIWCDGTKMAYDDGVIKASYEELLDRADLKAQMATPYPLGAKYPIPGVNEDPGRARHEPFFRKMYGDSARAVERQTTKVAWMPKNKGKRLRVTRVNGVDKRLAQVSAELEQLPGPLRALASSTSGAFVWRPIKGHKRLSMHSFAIAVDVGVPSSDFWGWVKREPDGTLRYRNRFPLEVVEVFERHGFIWGGKWYHFDTMHFEYRPELLCLARRRTQKKGSR